MSIENLPHLDTYQVLLLWGKLLRQEVNRANKGPKMGHKKLEEDISLAAVLMNINSLHVTKL